MNDAVGTRHPCVTVRNATDAGLKPAAASIVRDASGRDPLWGLVRVEIAEQRGASPASVAARANDVSRWVLAETLPLSLPDGRWDKMVYGIRDCEEFLRAIQ